MRKKGPTLIEVLRPRHFEPNSLRTKVTRTIRQPDTDALERLEELAAGTPRGAGQRGGPAAACPAR